MKEKIKQSNINLLKLFAMVLIALNHSMPLYGNKSLISYIPLGIASSNIRLILLNLLRCSGQIGNVIFIICSSWFLVDSNKIKVNKVLYIIFNSFIISILFLIIMLCFGVKLNSSVLLSQFIPIIKGNNWFISCYFVYYIIHPLLNIIVEKLSKKELYILNLFFISLYSIIQFLFSGSFYFNNLIGFILIYFIVAYVKKYMSSFQKNKSLNLKLCIIAIILNTLLILGTNYLGLRSSYFASSVLKWNYNLANPFYILFGITLFNLFKSINFKNNVIDYLSSLSLLFYIIHENILFRNYVKPYFYQTVFQNGNIIRWIFVEAFVLFIGGLLLSIIYDKFINKLVGKLSNKLGSKIDDFYKQLKI